MEGEFEEEEDLGEVSPSGDVERMIGGGCPAAGYKGRRRVSVDGGHQGIAQLHLQLKLRTLPALLCMDSDLK